MLRTPARPWHGGRKAAQTIRSCQQIPCALSLLTAAAKWAHSGYRGNRDAHWLPIPSAGLVTSQQTPSGKSCQMSATNGSNDPIWNHQFVCYKSLQWPHLTPSSGRFFQKVTDRWADHRNQLLVPTGTLKCLAKPNPAAISSNDLLVSKNPANEPILVKRTNGVIENERKLPIWTTATFTRLHKWYLISLPWTPIAPQMRPSNLTASGSCNFKEKKDS